jgi:hypothetical protein
MHSCLRVLDKHIPCETLRNKTIIIGFASEGCNWVHRNVYFRVFYRNYCGSRISKLQCPSNARFAWAKIPNSGCIAEVHGSTVVAVVTQVIESFKRQGMPGQNNPPAVGGLTVAAVTQVIKPFKRQTPFRQSCSSQPMSLPEGLHAFVCVAGNNCVNFKPSSASPRTMAWMWKSRIAAISASW